MLEAPALSLLTGGEAVAVAVRQIDPDVFPVYPITPQTPIIQSFAQMVADGQARTEIINVESEHSAMSAAAAAALAGARTLTATSSQGLALMVEVVYIAASLRAPVVMAVGNRALSGPINIHADHSDAMLARDTGWVQLFAENAQEAYDLMLLAPRLAEHPEVRLPVMVGLDGFTITHSAEPVALLGDAKVQAWVGEYRHPYPLLDTANPVTVGPFAMPDSYFELRYQLQEALERVPGVLEALCRGYARLSGREYAAFESYRLEDAERALVVMGSAAGTAKEAIDRLREQGEKVGLLKLRLFRPFPAQALREALAHVPHVAVLDRALSLGSFPPLYAEVCAALYGSPTRLQSYAGGLGGREIYTEDLMRLFGELAELPAGPTRYVGLRR
ncbi:pyruvate ferredoxin oxidoreductase [Calidithermus chliarophilus]|uniref:pyruvate ferredoxin oxidoreductase n=1 Tax=Calidithermus chliarophilus TaxID=52023 RepID=UPI0003FCCBAB|nr:pyruvate ferredoxin oxidoreductase [Calidithermus chliarophilus]